MRPSREYGLPSFVRSAKNRRSRASSSRKRLSTTMRPTSSADSRRSWVSAGAPAVNRGRARGTLPVRMTVRSTEDAPDGEAAREAVRRAEELEDGTLDPDELDAEPAWWDEGSDDET